MFWYMRAHKNPCLAYPCVVTGVSKNKDVCLCVFVHTSGFWLILCGLEQLGLFNESQLLTNAELVELLTF